MLQVERRSGDPRDECRIEAFIRTDPTTRYPCLIANICQGGAKLVVADAATIPATFTVLIPLLPDLFEERAADVRWRSGRQLGVRFLETARPRVLSS